MGSERAEMSASAGIYEDKRRTPREAMYEILTKAHSIDFAVGESKPSGLQSRLVDRAGPFRMAQKIHYLMWKRLGRQAAFDSRLGCLLFIS